MHEVMTTFDYANQVKQKTSFECLFDNSNFYLKLYKLKKDPEGQYTIVA
jgi:hypothetical protein